MNLDFSIGTSYATGTFGLKEVMLNVADARSSEKELDSVIVSDTADRNNRFDAPKFHSAGLYLRRDHGVPCS